jgi:hypothetical protein
VSTSARLKNNRLAVATFRATTVPAYHPQEDAYRDLPVGFATALKTMCSTASR